MRGEEAGDSGGREAVSYENRVGLKDIEVSGVWLRRSGDKAQVLVELKGVWHLVIEEHWNGQFSHISEPEGIKQSPVDRITVPPSPDPSHPSNPSI